MDYNVLINAIFNYGSIILAILLGLVTAVTMIVDVVKRLLPKVPTDLVVFITSIALTVVALFICAEIMQITVMWYYAVGAVVLGIAVAYAAMFGWDKFTALWTRLKNYMNK
ncbi:MAG: hypothetical protein J6Q53_02410 [Oscillospiraceae bacterium]|nr:hypothetical protein [Oscillospiraceae bacterium]